MRTSRIGTILLTVGVATLSLMLAPGGAAQDISADDSGEKWYQVEVLVFERRGEQVLSEESWDPDPGHPPIEESIALIVPGESPVEGPGPHAFRVLPAEALALSKIRGHLENGAETTPILHVAWRQPGVPRDDAQWINLYLPPSDTRAGRDPGSFLGMARRTSAPHTAAGSQPALIPLDALQQPMASPPLLDGTIRVYLARYLHADVDLVYHRHGVETPFRLATSRRMRSGELHYLDHPVFGVLIKVIPFEAQKIE
ncbi:MAG TPA: CsiV family protein [Gammaproteobacteria bacterium]|nr:CsiV family protein [Gammaproteobacteria bacterium]